MSRVLAVLLALLFLLPFDVSAQEDEALPACNASEVLAIWTALADFDMASVSAVIGDLDSDDRAARIEVIAAISDVQRQWWGEVAPSLPACWLGQKTGIVVGRVFDETLTVALLRLAADQAAELGQASTARTFNRLVDAHGLALDNAAYMLENNFDILP